MLLKLSLPSPRFRVLSQEIQKRPFQTDVSISCIPKDEPRGEENANGGGRAQPAGQLACLPPARPSWPSQAQSAVKKPRFLTASVRRLLRRRASAARRAARLLTACEAIVALAGSVGGQKAKVFDRLRPPPPAAAGERSPQGSSPAYRLRGHRGPRRLSRRSKSQGF